MHKSGKLFSFLHVHIRCLVMLFYSSQRQQEQTSLLSMQYINSRLINLFPIADRQFVRKSETKTKIGRFQQMHINRSMVNGQGKILFQEMTRDFILKFISMYFQTCIIQISLLSINLSIFYMCLYLLYEVITLLIYQVL